MAQTSTLPSSPLDPWANEDRTNLEWEFRGIECSISIGPAMCWCGYVMVPTWHHWCGKHYEEIDEYIEVHGGLTFSADCEPPFKPHKGWWIGFDCAHAGDLSPPDPRWPQELIDNHRTRYHEYAGVYRTRDYTIEQTMNLAIQVLTHGTELQVAVHEAIHRKNES